MTKKTNQTLLKNRFDWLRILGQGVGIPLVLLFILTAKVNPVESSCRFEYIEKPAQLDSITINRASVYQAVPEQTNADNLTTASGFKLNPEFNHLQYRILAVSRDLLEIFEYGDSVLVSGTTGFDGWWYIHDTMNKRYKNTVDFLTDPGTYTLYNNITLYYEIKSQDQKKHPIIICG